MEEITSNVTELFSLTEGDPVASAQVKVFQTKVAGKPQISGGQAGTSSSDGASPETSLDAIGRFSVPLIYLDVTEVRVTKQGFKEKRLLFAAGQYSCQISGNSSGGLRHRHIRKSHRL